MSHQYLIFSAHKAKEIIWVWILMTFLTANKYDLGDPTVSAVRAPREDLEFDSW